MSIRINIISPLNSLGWRPSATPVFVYKAIMKLAGYGPAGRSRFGASQLVRHNSLKHMGTAVVCRGRR
jgi:hypothetical protein